MTGWKIHHEWRCISDWTWGFSNVMFFFQGGTSEPQPTIFVYWMNVFLSLQPTFGNAWCWSFLMQVLMSTGINWCEAMQSSTNCGDCLCTELWVEIKCMLTAWKWRLENKSDTRKTYVTYRKCQQLSTIHSKIVQSMYVYYLPYRCRTPTILSRGSSWHLSCRTHHISLCHHTQ